MVAAARAAAPRIRIEGLRMELSVGLRVPCGNGAGAGMVPVAQAEDRVEDKGAAYPQGVSAKVLARQEKRLIRFDEFAATPLPPFEEKRWTRSALLLSCASFMRAFYHGAGAGG